MKDKYLVKLTEIIGEKPWIYKFFSDEVKADRDIAKATFKKDGSMLEFAPDEFKNDKEMVLIAVDTGDAYLYASEELQHDKDVILLALEWDSAIIEEFDEEFYEDLDVMYKAVYMDAENFEYLVEELQKDKDVAKKCVSLNCDVYDYLCDELKKDREIIETAIKNGYLLGGFLNRTDNYKEIYADKELIDLAIECNGGNEVCLATNEIIESGELAEKAITKGLCKIEGLNKERRYDKKTVKAIFANMSDESIVRKTAVNVMGLPVELLLDDDFMLELICDNEYVFQAMTKEWFQEKSKREICVKVDTEFCKRVSKVNPKTIKYMSNDMKKSVKM